MRSTVDFASRIDPVSGTDITGDGIPEVVIERDSGGAGCCVSYVIESLGEHARTIPLHLSSPARAAFGDLDGDGAFEVIGADGSFRCVLCCCANSPEPVVVLKYVEGQGYVPANPEFPEVYDALIPEYRARAEACQHGPFDAQDPTGRCCILPLVLALLYSGRAGSAWDAAEQHFQSAGEAAALRAEVEEIVAGSRLYVAEDWGALLAVRQETFSVSADLDGDGADETILGIGAVGADKVAEFMRPGDVYVCSSASTAQAPDILFACRTALPADLLPGFFEAQPVFVGDLDHDGLDEVVLVWLEQYWWPTAIRPLAVLQFRPADGTYEMVTDVSRFTCEIGDYAAEDVDGDGRIEILEIRPTYGSDINPEDGVEEFECHFCPHRYEVGVFEFTGQAFVADEDVYDGQPFVTSRKYAPYQGDGPVTSFLPELIASIRSLVRVP